LPVETICGKCGRTVAMWWGDAFVTVGKKTKGLAGGVKGEERAGIGLRWARFNSKCPYCKVRLELSDDVEIMVVDMTTYSQKHRR